MATGLATQKEFQPKKLFHWQMSRACNKSHWFERQHHHNITVIVTIHLSQNQYPYDPCIITYLYRKKQSNVGKYTLIPWEINKKMLSSKNPIQSKNLKSPRRQRAFVHCHHSHRCDNCSGTLQSSSLSRETPPEVPPSTTPLLPTPYQQELTRKRLSF